MYIVALGDGDGDVGGHPGQQDFVRSFQRDTNVIGDHILRCCCIQANLLHFAVEGAIGEGVDGEANFLAGLDFADVAASAKLESMRISDRSCAVVSVGVCRLATVCPRSTTRSTTIPETGERIVVKLRLT